MLLLSQTSRVDKAFSKQMPASSANQIREYFQALTISECPVYRLIPLMEDMAVSWIIIFIITRRSSLCLFLSYLNILLSFFFINYAVRHERFDNLRVINITLPNSSNYYKYMAYCRFILTSYYCLLRIIS